MAMAISSWARPNRVIYCTVLVQQVGRGYGVTILVSDITIFCLSSSCLSLAISQKLITIYNVLKTFEHRKLPRRNLLFRKSLPVLRQIQEFIEKI